MRTRTTMSGDPTAMRGGQKETSWTGACGCRSAFLGIAVIGANTADRAAKCWQNGRIRRRISLVPSAGWRIVPPGCALKKNKPVAEAILPLFLMAEVADDVTFRKGKSKPQPANHGQCDQLHHIAATNALGAIFSRNFRLRILPIAPASLSGAVLRQFAGAHHVSVFLLRSCP